MASLRKIFLVLVFISVLAGFDTLGQIIYPNYTINVDEKGNLTFEGGIPGPRGVLAPDPLNGNQPALCYSLPFPGNVGDVLLYPTNEPPGGPHQFSDLIRFEGNSRMYFYSLADDGAPPDLADVSVLPTPLSPNAAIWEINPIVQVGTVWLVGTSGIGGDPHNLQTQYKFITLVPEPASLLLSGLLLLIRQRQQTRHLSTRTARSIK